MQLRTNSSRHASIFTFYLQPIRSIWKLSDIHNHKGKIHLIKLHVVIAVLWVMLRTRTWETIAAVDTLIILTSPV